MESNLGYLLAVFSIAWAVIFGYVWTMINNQKKLYKKLDALKQELKEKGLEG
jgi:CcmD family protein